jgi:UDP-N-acetylmuramoyl-L-alanyl-D-glutamate--2,6-diaminopimelate ligase
MAELSLRELSGLGLAKAIVGDPLVRVRGIRHDSRRCEPGDLFVAVAGAQSDGAQFIEDAVKRGAVAVLAERPLTQAVPVLLADDALVALSAIAQRLYDDPTVNMPGVGVTGTNGKTTCTYLIESLLLAAEKKPAVLGTVSFRGPFGELPATHTTPMADDLMRLAERARAAGATHLVLEVSSHGLAMHRVDGVHFDVAAFTNLTQDHLDYHGDFASYENAKRRLFRELGPRIAVVNVDDAVGRSIAGEFQARAKGRVLRCSKTAAIEHDVCVLSNEPSRDGIRARVRCMGEDFDLESPLLGEHNVENLLIAIGCGAALGLSVEVMQRALKTAQGAPGRLQRIDHPHDVLIFVDYAHTPDALARVLTTLRANTTGRLLVTFGCGGDRDPLKRPIMGKHSAELADIVVLTTDNPRSEVPERILEQIENGVREAGMQGLETAALAHSARGYHVEPDRAAAIQLLVAAARPGDTVLIAGKGHEKVQIVGQKRLPFDDVQVAQQAVAGLPEGS